MFKFLNNMPIFRRLFIIFALAAIVPVIVILVLGNFFLVSLDQRSQAVATSFDAQSIASQEQNNLQRMNARLETLQSKVTAVLTGAVQDPSLSASGALITSDITARVLDFQQTLQTYDTTYEISTSPNMTTIRNIIQNDSSSVDAHSIIDGQANALDNVVGTQWPNYQAKQLIVLNKLSKNFTNLTQAEITQNYESIYSSLYDANIAFVPLINNWQNVVDAAVTMGKTVTRVGPSQTQPILAATIIAIVSVVIIILLSALIVNLTIIQRLGRLASLTRKFTTGEMSLRADIPGKDEINLVATSMNLMLDNIVNLINAAERQRDELQTQVEKLLGEVSGVGEGDLSVQAQVTAGTLGALADSFNFMVEELSNLVIRVKMVAGEVENSTTMTLGRMKQLVISTDIQIGQITQATTEVEHMATSSLQVAERAQMLYNGAIGARQSAQVGRQSVQLTVEGIGRIQEYVQNTSTKVQTLGERSRAINTVVEAIASIAHQTNRLSLDAAIQAAMAGESGKGFRAVADDIRRLAEDAKTQAHSITQLVKSVREDIGALAVSMKDTERETQVGTNQAQQTGHSLDAIFGVVEQQAQEIETINRAARQQSESSNTVVQIMQSVSNSTMQNTASTHTVEQSMERLARLAQQLQASVGAFKLRDNGGTSRPQERNIEGTMRNGNGQIGPNGLPWSTSRPLPALAGTDAATNSRKSPRVTGPMGDNTFTPFPSPSQRRDNGQRAYPAPQHNQNTGGNQ